MATGYIAIALACLAHYRIDGKWVWLAAAIVHLCLGLLVTDWGHVTANILSIISIFSG